MPSDEELAARLAEGDERALEALLRRHGDGLAHFVHRHTGGHDVEDLVQETWLRVVRSAGDFDPRRRFSTWLFQICINLCRDWHRRRAAGPVTDTRTEPAAPPSNVALSIDVAGALARLPLEQREAVVLRYYYDMSEKDMAAVIGVAAGTVKSRLHAGLAALADLLDEEGGR
jgi:RNA polymerase sigma-70 factor (ECF subfamily)